MARTQAQAWRVIQRIADDLEPQMRREFLAAVERLRAAIDLVRLATAIERGDITVVNLTLTDAVIARELRAAAETVRRLTLDALRVESLRVADQAHLSTAFRLSNPLAAQIAERQAARFVTRVGRETRAAIRAAIVAGVRANTSRAQVQQQILAVVGLTERQARAVERLRASGASADAVARYAQRLLRLRARTIARTETMAAANAGQQAAWQAAQRAGLLPLGAKRTWITTPDDRLCPLCQVVGGQVVGIDEPFQTPLGAVMNPPLHPNCRCAIGLDAASLTAARTLQQAA